MIRVGDRVKFLSDTGEGVVTSIKGSIATVEVEDGFDIPVTLDQIVAVAKEEELRAVSLIGVSDPKPGRVKGVQKSPEEKSKPRRLSSAQRYGRVSLVDDEQEEIFDIHAMRAQYRRTVTEVNRRSTEIDRKEAERLYNRSVGEIVQDKKVETAKAEPQPEPKPEQKPAQEPAPAPVVERIEPKVVSKISLEELARRMGVKPEKKPEKKKERPEKKPDIEVIDLHATEILPSTEGLVAGEIITAQLSRFTIALESAIKSGGHGKMVFIHGVGKGKLKYEMTKLLQRNYPKISYQDASFREYGYGAIMIFY